MATFRFGRDVNMKWQGNDIQGPAGTIFRISDAYYEEFNDQVGSVEPTLEWLVTNELGAVQANVAGLPVSATLPITATTSTSGTNIAISAGTSPSGYVLTSNGSGIAAFAAATGGGAAGVSSITGTAPIAASAATGAVTLSLNANYATSTHDHAGTYQPAGTYVTSVSGTAPISASGTTAITVGIDQTSLSAASALNAEALRHSVKNTTGTTIPKGSAVYVSGATGDNALISLASASSEVTSSKTLGITAESIANDAFGYVTEAGYLTGINTSATTAGAAVWLGNTPGSLVFVSPPAEPSNLVYLGVVARVHSNNGSILVKVQNGYELNELHDVSASSPSDGDIIQYKTSSSLWTKSSIAGAGIAASTHTHSYQPAGTYVTAVNGTAPIAASTNTAGVVSVSLDASYSTSTHLHTGTYDPAGTAASEVATHEADTTSVHGITNTANLLTTTSGMATISNATATATTISSTTSSAPTDVSGLSHVFTPTYDENVLVQANLIYTQSASPAATVDIISRVIVNGTIVSPQGGFTRLAASHGSPTGLTQSFSHTFAAISGTSYTAKVGVYKSSANGTFSASNISSFTITRVRA